MGFYRILAVFEVLTETDLSAAKAETNTKGVAMATTETVELVGAVLRQIDEARSLEQRIGEHFGDSSDIGNLAYRSRHQLIELFVGIAQSFKDGLTMKAGQLYRLGQLFADQDTLEQPATLSKYLDELTDHVIAGIEAEGNDTYRMVFDHDQLQKKSRN